MPTKGVCFQQETSCSVESQQSESNSLCLAPERYFGSLDIRESQCHQEVETMPSKMAASAAQQPSCSSSSVESPPSDSNSSSRYHRNLAEKQRRDKLNGYITELATLVPMVSMTTRRLDKTSILRLSAAYLRIYQSKLNPRKCKKISWGPNILNSDHLNELLQASGGILLIASFPEKIIYASPNVENILSHQNERFLGKIIYVSSNVEKILGQQNIDMIGQSLFHFIHPDDVKYVHDKLKSLAPSSDQKSSSSNRSVFCARMKERSMPRSESVNYQLMHFSCSQDIEDDYHTPHDRKHTAAKRGKSTSMEPKSDILITAFIKPVTTNPLNELSITEAFQEEYVTRHGVDGKILFADHRISTITGHLPHEVQGMSAYEYIIDKDIPVAILAHKRMFSSIDGTGMIVYRLRTAAQSAVYLKSIGHLQFEKGSTKVCQFICINKLMSEEDGERELQKFIEHYTPHINGASSPPVLNAILPNINPTEVPRILDPTFNSKVQSTVPQAISAPPGGIEAQPCTSYSLPEICPTVASPIESMLPAGMRRNSQNGDVETATLSPCTYSSGTAHSPNRLFDFESSNYPPAMTNAQHCEKDDLHQEEGNFSNGYYVFAAAICSKISSEQSLSASHSTDQTAAAENGAELQRYVSKRKRSIKNMYDSSQSAEMNCSAEPAQSKYTKFGTEPRDNLRRVQSTTEKRSRNSLSDKFSYTGLVGHHPTEENNFVKADFPTITQTDICRNSLQGYLLSPGVNVADHFDPVKAVCERHLSGIAENSSEDTTSNAARNSRTVNTGWHFNGDSTSPSLGGMNHVQSSHFNGHMLPSVEYQNGVNSVGQNFTVDQTEDWLSDSFSCLNSVDDKY